MSAEVSEHVGGFVPIWRRNDPKPPTSWLECVGLDQIAYPVYPHVHIVHTEYRDVSECRSATV